MDQKVKKTENTFLIFYYCILSTKDTKWITGRAEIKQCIFVSYLRNRDTMTVIYIDKYLTFSLWLQFTFIMTTNKQETPPQTTCVYIFYYFKFARDESSCCSFLPSFPHSFPPPKTAAHHSKVFV